MSVKQLSVRQMIDRLISYNTVSRDSNLELIHFVQEYLESHGVASTLVPNDDATKANLYASVGPEAEGGVVLSGHTDVVPVDGQPWTSDPFTVKEKDGLLYGRGTCDMKSFIAIGLALVPDMSHLKRPVHFALSYDEEIGCIGAPRMIEKIKQNLPRPDAVIVGEPTSMRVVTAHKGIYGVRTMVTGHEAHSSQTHRGVSAVMVAARLISWLSDRAAKFRDNADPASGFEPAFTTISVGVVHGGTASNIIARECYFDWDIRHLPGDSPDDIVSEFRRFCLEEVEPEMKQVAPNSGIQTTVRTQAPALSPDPENSAEVLAKNVLGDHKTYKVPYAAEAGQFQEAGFPTIICGPGSIDQAHQPDEFISLEQVDAGTVFLRGVISSLSA